MKKIMSSISVAVALACFAVVAGSPPQAIAAEHPGATVVAAVYIGSPPDIDVSPTQGSVLEKKAVYDIGTAATIDAQAALDTDFPVTTAPAFKEDGKTKLAATIDTSPTGTTTAPAFDSSGGEQQIGYLDS